MSVVAVDLLLVDLLLVDLLLADLLWLIWCYSFIHGGNTGFQKMDNLISWQIVYCLYDATWPFNSKLFHDGVIGQTEMDALVVLRKAVHATTLFAHLRNRSSGREHSRANTITI